MGIIETTKFQLEPMTKEKLAKHAPVTQTKKHSNTSERYTFASTAKIVEVFEASGWSPVNVQSSIARTAEREGFQKHTVIFANKEFSKGMLASGTIPRIVLKNAHDKSSALHFLAGLYEQLCANGLIVGHNTGDIKCVHQGLNDDKITAAIKSVTQNLEKAMEVSDRMRSRVMGQDEREAFAKQAVELAFDTEKYLVSPKDLLVNHRVQQSSRNLWDTFNTIQEKVLRGGVVRIRKDDGGRQSSRAVNEINRSVKLNRGLWDIAEGYLA